MTLNATGPISLGGTTTGQSIEIELGGTGTTTISLNDTTVRTLAGVASGTIVMPTNFYGKSSNPAASYWYSYAYNVNFPYSTSYSFIKSKGSYVVYGGVAGRYNTLLKRDLLNGSFSWGQSLYSSINNFWDFGPEFILIDSSDNLYFSVSPQNSANTGTVAVLVKYNASGTLQFKNTIIYSVTPSNRSYCFGVFIDSSDIVYLSVFFSPNLYKIVKLSSGGTVADWTKSFEGYPITFEKLNSGNIAVVAIDSTGTGFIATYDSTFSTNITKKTITITNIQRGYISSDNSFFVGGYITGYGVIAKYNSSGTIVWSLNVRASGSTAAVNIQSVVTDSDGNSYWTISGSIIVKVDPSGTVLWQRYISCLPNATGRITIALTPTNPSTFTVLFGGGSTYTLNCMNLPVDGTKTGTKTLNGNSIVYGVGNYVFTTGTASSFSTTLANPGASTNDVSFSADTVITQPTFAATYNSVLAI